jgi:Ni/Co efflux regulator RcnB
MARIVAIVVVAALAAAPAAAPAAPRGGTQRQAPAPQQSLLQDTAPQQQAPAPVQQAPQQTEVDSGTIGGGQLLLIGAVIVALIGGIWFVIARDARRVTAGRVRTDDGELGAGRGGSPTRAARRGRRLSAEERRRRKRGRARAK